MSDTISSMDEFYERYLPREAACRKLAKANENHQRHLNWCWACSYKEPCTLGIELRNAVFQAERALAVKD